MNERGSISGVRLGGVRLVGWEIREANWQIVRDVARQSGIAPDEAANLIIADWVKTRKELEKVLADAACAGEGHTNMYDPRAREAV